MDEQAPTVTMTMDILIQSHRAMLDLVTDNNTLHGEVAGLREYAGGLEQELASIKSELEDDCACNPDEDTPCTDCAEEEQD